MSVGVTAGGLKLVTWLVTAVALQVGADGSLTVTVALCVPAGRSMEPLQVEAVAAPLSKDHEQVGLEIGVPSAPVALVSWKFTLSPQVAVSDAVAVGLPKLNCAGPARSFKSGLVPPDPEERVITEPKKIAPHTLDPPVNTLIGTAASAKISGSRLPPVWAMTPVAPQVPGAVGVVLTATAATPEAFSDHRLLVKSTASTAVVPGWLRVAWKTRNSGVPLGWKCPPSSTSPTLMS